ncbi:MAG: hypothetical protein ACOX5J_11165 [Candidatus Hydrogenedentales bacterium]
MMKGLLLIVIPLAVAFIGTVGTLLGVAITLIVQYCLSIRQQRDLFRLAALDKRLQVAQEAFELWRKLLSSLGNDAARNDAIKRCHQWWCQNCLYLSKEVRHEFYFSFISAHMADNENLDVRLPVRERILELGKLIEKSVGLPALSAYPEREEAKLKDDSS